MEIDPTLAVLLVTQSPDAVIFADSDGLVRVWNDAAATLFGFTAEQALGQSLDLIVPERFRDAHWTGFRRALGDGDTKYRGQALATRAVKQDGSTIYVELSFAIVHGEDRAVIGALAHARDITERFLREREERRQREAAAGGA
ncbi:MAG: PAS domain S-box protein [Chloroflexi bacterium]|nr:PAS domain S-box protein [Chloroflexota bacterium]MDA1003670.1 PAS domain S-box protein [Chloroflexota bacterium]